MLVQTITDEFNVYWEQNPDHDTILWFDPEHEWGGLLPYLSPRLPLLIYEGGQLGLRHKLAKRQAGERAVVYLPMKQDDARYLRPYFYTSKCHHASIEKTLRQAGVNLPADPAAMRQLRPLLPALAIASVDKGRAFWDGIVNHETALGHLIADLDDMLLRLLAQPQRALAEMERQGLRGPFFDLVKIEFGITPPEAEQEEVWLDRFTALLCLVDLYAAAPTPDFPFKDILPPSLHWDRHRGLLNKWQHHEFFKASFRRRAKAIDAQYPLGVWAAKLPLPPANDSFLNVEQAVWQAVQTELDAIQSKAEAIEFAREKRPLLAQRAETFWAREGELPGWRALARMAEAILSAQDALDELDKYATAAVMIKQYARTWWKVDHGFRRFRTELDRSTGHLDAALKWSSRIYQDYLEQTNNRFTQLVAQEGSWPPAGQPMGAKALWDQALQPGRKDIGLRALILVDALRYELAQELAERLELGPADTEAWCSSAPSVTELGMAALLPGWPTFQVDYGGEWLITPPNSLDNLARKDKRLAWLAAQLGAAITLDLDRWLSLPLSELNTGLNWIVISSTAIDAVSEGAGTVALYTFDSLLERLEHGVRRLLAAGCSEVHIVADHGFLLLETMREADKVKVEAEGVLKKRERYLLGRDVPAANLASLPSLPVPGSRDLVAWFPRGVGCFVTPGPYNYVHGGIALQEIVIPHICVRQSVAERFVGVSLELVGGSEIHNAIFKIRLAPEGVDLLSKPRQVEIDIVKGNKRVSGLWEERIGHNVVERPLMLEAGRDLAVGDEVQIRVRDAATGELLAQQAATVYIDLDL